MPSFPNISHLNINNVVHTCNAKAFSKWLAYYTTNTAVQQWCLSVQSLASRPGQWRLQQHLRIIPPRWQVQAMNWRDYNSILQWLYVNEDNGNCTLSAWVHAAESFSEFLSLDFPGWCQLTAPLEYQHKWWLRIVWCTHKRVLARCRNKLPLQLLICRFCTRKTVVYQKLNSLKQQHHEALCIIEMIKCK